MSKSHKIGLSLAVIIGMNAMIGASIFIIPKRLLDVAGPASLLSYVFVTISVLCLAFSLAKVARLSGQEGSFYIYVKNWAGENWGVVAVASYSMGLLISMGLLTRMVGIYLNQIFPSILSMYLSIFVLVGLMITILLGAKILKVGQLVLIALTILPIVLVMILCFSNANFANLTPFMPNGFGSVLNVTKIVIFGFFGFESITALYHMVHDPEKNVPKAITAAVILTGLAYIIFTGSIFLGINQLVFEGSETLAEALYQTFSNFSWLINLIVWGIVIAIAGTIHSIIWSVSTLIESVFRLVDKEVNFKVSVIGVSVFILLSCLLLTNIDLFFNLAVLFVVPVIMGSIMPVLFNALTKDFPVKSNLIEKIVALVGLSTGLVMIAYALKGLFDLFFN